MSNGYKLQFPDLVFFQDHGGNFKSYFDVVYLIFQNDFIKNQPYYNGFKVGAKKYPEVDGIHRTFYHITHEGDIESDRLPDFKRMERIRFPKFCIDNCPHSALLIWEKKIGNNNRIHILNEEEKYIVVLNERNGYYLFWTAFYIEQNHTLRKKKNEYEAYKKAKTA